MDNGIMSTRIPVDSDGLCPKEYTGWSMNQLVDAVLAAQREHRLISARKSDSLW